MTIDIESPQGNVLNYSIISSDEDDNHMVLKLKLSRNNKIPRVVLTKLDTNQYVVSPKTSTRQRKPKTFDDFETEMPPRNHSVSPNKRTRSKKIDPEDIEMTSPTKKVRTPQKTPVRTRLFDDNLEGICKSITNNVKLTTPRKRTSDFSDTESVEMKSSEKKRPENILLEKRQVRTPSKYIDVTSPVKSGKENFDESFRRSVLRRLNMDSVAKSLTGSPKKEKINRNSPKVTPKKSNPTRRSARISSAHFYFDTSGDEDTQIQTAVNNSIRDSRTRNNSTSSVSTKNRDSDPEFVPVHTPRRRKQILRTRKDSTESYVSEASPERGPTKEIPKTPKTPRNRRHTVGTPKSVKATPKTPKNRLKLIRDGTITPSMQARTNLVPKESTPLMMARSQLHVSYVPTCLPCREKEYLEVHNFIRTKLDDGYGGCMYISGVPGTGKTATVTSVIDNLQKDDDIIEFCYVNINGMRLTEPRQSYVEIWKQLTGKTVPWEQAQSLLEERFTKKKNLGPVVMLIDELDILCTKRQDVVYNLLDWPSKCKDQLIVITIANTMDLPERLLMSRVASRLGLTRLTFQAYSHKQLMEIVTKRLTGTDSFNPDAVQLVARKVASVSGDARRALDICRRAAEIAEAEGKAQLVNIAHINEALTAMITQPQVLAIRRCSKLQRLILQAIVAEMERTGVEETTFSDVFKMLVSCCALEGFKMVSSTVAQKAVSELSACRLLITDQKCGDIFQRIILNVSVHDVYFALKKD